MVRAHLNVAAEIEAYAAYLNARHAARRHLDEDELVEFEADALKAKAQMERAWLENKPTQGESSA